MKKRVYGFLLLAAFAMGLTACGNAAANTSSKTSSGTNATTSAADIAKASENQSETTKAAATITVAYSPTSYPLSYVDETGNVTGYEIEVLKAVDTLLNDYEFVYEGNDYATNYVGLSSGVYDIVLSNAFYTDERAEQYNLTEQFLGKSEMGIIVPNEYADGINGFDDIPEGWKMKPLVAGNGLTWVIDNYNEEHPDHKLIYDGYVENFLSNADVLRKIEKGQYNYDIQMLSSWSNNVVAENGELHEYNDKFTYIPAFLVSTYPVIAKSQTELAAQVNDALVQLYQEGTLAKLSEEFYGYNQFELSNQNTDIKEN